jgi:hypothetical protein
VTGFDRSPKPAQRSPEGLKLDGPLRPEGRPTRGPLDQNRALPPRRQELAPGKAGRYRGGNCPGRGNAPIEACRKADGLRFVLDVT